MRLSYGHGLPCMNTVAAPCFVMMWPARGTTASCPVRPG